MELAQPKRVFQRLQEQFAISIDWLSSLFPRKNTGNTSTEYVRALISNIERKNSWQMSEAVGRKDPYGFQHLLGRSTWDCDFIRDQFIKKIIADLGNEDSIISIDETGFLKKGKHSAGVARQYSGTAGRIENCQIGVFLNYSTSMGHTLLDRELYLPKEWVEDKSRLQNVGIDPQSTKFQTKIELARVMVERSLNLGARPNWVVADSVYGSDTKLRMWLENRNLKYVLSVTSKQYVCIGFQQFSVKNLFEKIPQEDWSKLSCGTGTKGRKIYMWAAVKINHPYSNKVARFALCRQSIKDSSEKTYYLAFASRDTCLEEMVRVAGRRWTIEECFETAKGEVGLDQYEVRSVNGWYRHMTLAMVAQSILVTSRAKFFPQQSFKPTMKEFKKKRGLLSA